MDTVYIETSIVSHASARPSRDLQTAALQEQARLWWTNERPKFHLVTSQLTITESSEGDPVAAAERLKLLDGIELIPLGTEVDNLAQMLLQKHLMPQKAAADAAHVAAAAVARVNYLLTLNCKHIANARELPRVYRLLDELGYGQLLICTPNEFLGEDNDVEESHP